MIYFLMGLILLTLFVERRRDNRLAIIIYGGINCLHSIIPAFENGLVYYGGCALTDLIIISLLAWFVGNRLSRSLMIISLISILFNIGGFTLWLTYKPLGVYNGLMMVLYFMAFLVILVTGRYDDRRRADDNRDHSVCSDTCSSSPHLSHGKE